LSSTSEADGIVGNYTIDLVQRAPCEAYRIAPNILAGGGLESAKSDNTGDRVNKWLGQVGAGIEFKPTYKFSIFAGWIYNRHGASQDVPNNQEIRKGVEFGF
jgi:opacity protein-like surface antigen